MNRAREVVDAIIAAYYAPSRKFTCAEEIIGHNELDILGAFSESCRGFGPLIPHASSLSASEAHKSIGREAV